MGGGRVRVRGRAGHGECTFAPPVGTMIVTVEAQRTGQELGLGLGLGLGPSAALTFH